MSRGHNWVFRAESHEEMLTWYKDIEQLVQLPNMSASQRQNFIASHAPEDVVDRPRQSGSSSPGLDEDEADEVPYSPVHTVEDAPRSPERPPPGGSFPSETKLDDSAMYRRHSRAGSDATNELTFTGEDVNPTVETPRLQRAFTTASYGSIGDDAAFTAAAVGAGVTGATVVGAAAVTATRKKKKKNEDVIDGEAKPEPPKVEHVTVPPVPQQPEKNIAPEPTPHVPDDDALNKRPVVSEGGAVPVDDAVLEGVIGTTAVGGAVTTTAQARDRDGDNELMGAKYSTLDSEYENDSRSQIKEALAPPTENDPSLSQVNGTGKSSLAVPTKSLQRSKSKKEIVEEAIADAIGNNPQRGMTPGAWPKTPADQLGRREYI
jgi:hypothetical protein